MWAPTDLFMLSILALHLLLANSWREKKCLCRNNLLWNRQFLWSSSAVTQHLKQTVQLAFPSVRVEHWKKHFTGGFLQKQKSPTGDTSGWLHNSWNNLCCLTDLNYSSQKLLSKLIFSLNLNQLPQLVNVDWTGLSCCFQFCFFAFMDI